MTHAPSSRHQAGFTLTSTVIVVTVFGVLAGATVPRLVLRPSTRNEHTVVATLTAIADAEQQCHRLGFLDVDLDGRAEFATLGELTGNDALRREQLKIDPALLRTKFKFDGSIGLAERNGYYFALFLPDEMGQGCLSTAGLDANLTCHYWSCLAWPKQRGITGVHSYFVNQRGDVVYSTDAEYSGTEAMPPAGAALLGVDAQCIDSNQVANGQGADRNHWIPAH